MNFVSCSVLDEEITLQQAIDKAVMQKVQTKYVNIQTSSALRDASITLKTR